MLLTNNFDETEIIPSTDNSSDTSSDIKYKKNSLGIEKLLEMAKNPSIPVYHEERTFLRSTFS